MLKKYIPSLITVLFVVGCSSSHTDKIKSEMKQNFDPVTYEQLGGEKDSLMRYKKYCEAFKEGKVNVVEMKMELLTHRPSFTNNELKLATAEINVANKDAQKKNCDNTQKSKQH